MIVLTTSELAQVISVIPRQYVSAFTFYITDDTTNVTETYEIDNAVRQVDNLTFNNVFNPVLIENRFYDLRFVLNNGYWNNTYKLWQNNNNLWNDVVLGADFYNDQIFCTDQEVNQLLNKYYDPNLGQFVYYDEFGNLIPIENGAAEDFVYYSGFQDIEDLEEGTPDEYVFYNGSSNTYIVR